VTTSRRCVVTGGAGFVGSHLCDRLLAGGAHVLCVDDFSTGRRANVSHLVDHPAFALLEHDVTVPLAVEADEIYHLACPASPVHYQRDPVRTTKTAVLGSINVLDLARSTGAKVLLASTSEVYGDPEVHPQGEEYWGRVNPIGPRSCYDEGKRCAETLFFDYHRQYGLPIKVVRIFNTYGPRMHPDDGRVVSNFVVQVLAGMPLTLHGDGTQTRSFCFVDDLVEGLVAMMATGAGVVGPVNLGYPAETTLLELVAAVEAAAGAVARVERDDLPVDDPVRRCPDITRARGLLGWEPRTDLAEGLRRTVASFRDRP
jgi:UDP-glucuronate decarboxylase